MVLWLSRPKRSQRASGGAGNARYGKCAGWELSLKLTKGYTMFRAVFLSSLDSAH